MIEQYSGYAVHPVALAVVDRDPVAVHLGDAVGAAGVERGALLLRHLDHLAEHLAARRLVEPDVVGAQQPDCLQHPGHPDGGELAGEHRLLPARRHEALGGEVVHLVGPRLLEHVDDRELVEQVGLVQVDLPGQVRDPLEVLGARPPDDPVDLVPVLQQ